MKLSKYIILAGSLFAMSGAHAAAVGNIELILDWNTLSVSSTNGAVIYRSSIADPPPGVSSANFSSDSYAWVGYGPPYIEDESGLENTDPTSYGSSYEVSTLTAMVDAKAGYDDETKTGYATGSISNDSLNDLYAVFGTDTGLIYHTDTAGTVNISLEYSVTGSVSAALPYENANVGYDVGVGALDGTLFISEYNSQINAGATDDEAEDAADALADLGGDENHVDNWIDSSGGDKTDDLTGTLAMSFEAEAGKYYAIFANSEGRVGTSAASPVPVPAALWLFGSGLVGLVGLGRRKQV